MALFNIKLSVLPELWAKLRICSADNKSVIAPYTKEVKTSRILCKFLFLKIEAMARCMHIVCVLLLLTIASSAEKKFIMTTEDSKIFYFSLYLLLTYFSFIEIIKKYISISIKIFKKICSIEIVSLAFL